MASSRSSAPGHPLPAGAAERWQGEVVAALQARTGGRIDGYEVVSVTFDNDYLRYFDRVLEEMSLRDKRLPHRRNSDRTLIRSAAVDVVMCASLITIHPDTGRSEFVEQLAPAITDVAGNILLGSLLRRLQQPGGEWLTPIELLLPPEPKQELDRKLRDFVIQYVMAEDHSFYLGAGFSDVRSAFIEALLMGWMIDNDLVAKQAVPACETHARLQARRRASRRPRWLGAV